METMPRGSRVGAALELCEGRAAAAQGPQGSCLGAAREPRKGFIGAAARFTIPAGCALDCMRNKALLNGIAARVIKVLTLTMYWPSRFCSKPPFATPPFPLSSSHAGEKEEPRYIPLM